MTLSVWCTYMFVCMYVCTYIKTIVFIYIIIVFIYDVQCIIHSQGTHIYLCIYICIYIYIYIYTYEDNCLYIRCSMYNPLTRRPYWTPSDFFLFMRTCIFPVDFILHLDPFWDLIVDWIGICSFKKKTCKGSKFDLRVSFGNENFGAFLRFGLVFGSFSLFELCLNKIFYDWFWIHAHTHMYTRMCMRKDMYC